MIERILLINQSIIWGRVWELSSQLIANLAKGLGIKPTHRNQVLKINFLLLGNSVYFQIAQYPLPAKSKAESEENG